MNTQEPVVALDTIVRLHRAHQLPPCWIIEGNIEQTEPIIRATIHTILSAPENGHQMTPDRIQTLMANGSYPNYLSISLPPDTKEVTLAMLAPLRHFMAFQSAVSGSKCVLITCIDAFNRFCVNSLLKIIEEPPRDTFVFMLSNNTSGLVQTLLSRCMKHKIYSDSSILYNDTAAQLIKWARVGDFSAIRRKVSQYTQDKSAYYTLATNVVHTFYQMIAQDKISHCAPLWLSLTTFWQQSVKRNLDPQHIVLAMLAGIADPVAFTQNLLQET